MISKGAVSKAVESLIRKSLLERLPDREDRRKIHLRLREQAKPLMEAVDQVREEFLAAVLKGFSSRDLATLVELQRRLFENSRMPWKEGEVIPNETERTGTDRHGTSENSENSKEFLRREPLGKLLVKLALPTVAAQLINMLYNIVDRIYIGHIPDIGASALTGVGVCMPLILIVSAFAALVGYGGSPRASIFMGRKDKDSAEKTLGNCFVLQILLSVILTAVLLIWNRDLLMAFGASEKTIGYGVDYMNIYAVGTIFVELTLGMNAFITAQGFAKTGMLSVLIGGSVQHYPGSHLYFRTGNERPGRGAGHDYFPGPLLPLGGEFSLRKADLSADPKEESAAGSQGDRPLRGPGGGYLYHAGQRECDLRLL